MEIFDFRGTHDLCIVTDWASVEVDPEMGNFENIKVGDTVHARYTEAVAVSVTEPQ